MSAAVSTGGAAQAREGTLRLVLGPKLESEVEHITAALGTTTQFEDAVTACAAKLLHNLVVILYNHALAMALLLADSAGVPSIESVLDNGTAGRPPSRASVVRDHRLGPTSSYTGGLVAKDIEALLSSFPQLETVPGIDKFLVTTHILV